MKKIIGLIIAIQCVVVSALAQKPAILIDNEPGWRKIAETTAAFSKEDESIVILGDDQFASIKMKVKDAPLNIDRLQVFYESGEMKEFDVKDKINIDSETRKFDLDPSKEVSQIAFTYQTVANDRGDKANVILYGFVQDDAADTKHENASYKRDTDISDDVSKTASKGMAELTDKRHKTKVGPNDQTIYIEETPPRYYYVDRQGQRVYVSQSQLRNKKDK